VILPNLALGQNVVPELLQQDATPDAMAQQTLAIIAHSERRERQLEAFTRLEQVMRLANDAKPSEAARDAILACIDQPRGNKKHGV
jgi:lipid-A-disaccharide synthase